QAWVGRLIAWDPATKRPAWTVDYPTAGNGGTLSTAGNLVFQGTADGRAVAYSADKGQKLWEARLNSAGMAGPVTYEVEGEQYVTFMAGWGGAFPLVAGPLSLDAKVQPEARVVTFKLDGKATLPPPRNAPAFLPPLEAVKLGPDEIKTARTMFNGLCASCHGLNAVSGGVVPDLRYLSPKKHETFLGVVYGAKINKGMPSFNGVIPPEEVERIRQYILKRGHDLKGEIERRTQSGATDKVAMPAK
ncbi:MAG TPA: c-type cytochrome, partial [Hydrogenophaga sp.]|nr:c-type cytochrome [Hydrogenophaga sp.]